MTGPPGLTVQVVAAAAGPDSRPTVRAPAAAAGRIPHARAAVIKDTKTGYDRGRRRVNARGGDSGTPAIKVRLPGRCYRAGAHGLIRQRPQQHQPGVRHDPGTADGDFQPFRQPVAFT